MKGDIYEHCVRAIDRSLTVGAHGLPLMGSGDWNDGMNRVGQEGRGKRLAWLVSHTTLAVPKAREVTQSAGALSALQRTYGEFKKGTRTEWVGRRLVSTLLL
jgi:cyclic beta-1,2-glucan synthetase